MEYKMDIKTMKKKIQENYDAIQEQAEEDYKRDEELQYLKSGKLKDVLLQEYIHNQVYRTLKSFIPFTIAWNKRRYHRMFINKMWQEYKEIENA